MSRRVNRRAALATAAAAAGAGCVGLTRLQRAPRDSGPARPTVAAAGGLPAAQHAWDGALRRDEHGNPLLPRHHRLLLLDLARTPDPAGAARIEDALRSLERRHARSPRRLHTLLAWGPAYFAAIGARSPIPPAAPLSDDEVPAIDDAPALLLLASDDESLLGVVRAALFEGAGGRSTDLRGVLRVREQRSGFAGAGLPARAQARAGGLDLTRRIPQDAPLFMGFRSGLRRNQATERDVTIPSGPLAGGTTLHLSTLSLELASWYELDERDRVARMYSPQQTPSEVARFTDAAPAPRATLAATAALHGRVGHTQALASVRRDGRPLILRRDVNTLDGGGPGVHFVSLQRTIEDFVTTRRAMSAARSRAAPQLTAQLNNGINEWMRVTRRGNWVVPPRAHRAFPLLPGAWHAA